MLEQDRYQEFLYRIQELSTALEADALDDDCWSRMRKDSLIGEYCLIGRRWENPPLPAKRPDGIIHWLYTTSFRFREDAEFLTGVIARTEDDREKIKWIKERIISEDRLAVNAACFARGYEPDHCLSALFLRHHKDLINLGAADAYLDRAFTDFVIYTEHYFTTDFDLWRYAAEILFRLYHSHYDFCYNERKGIPTRKPALDAFEAMCAIHYCDFPGAQEKILKARTGLPDDMRIRWVEDWLNRRAERITLRQKTRDRP